MSRQCLSASGAGRALTPARHLRLGGPLPRQLANITWAPPRAPELWSWGDAPLGTSLGITRSFPRLYPIMGLVTVALLTLAPLALRPVRLACLIHAANVHSEPGSNPSRLVVSPAPKDRKSRSSPSRVEECANWSQLGFAGASPCGSVLLAVGSVSVAHRPPTKRGRDDSNGSTPASLKGSSQP